MEMTDDERMARLQTAALLVAIAVVVASFIYAMGVLLGWGNPALAQYDADR